MKFLCVPCDSPMKLQAVGPPERGSLLVVYSCPECGYEMAMLTNAYQTQVVQSLGVRIGPDVGGGGSSTGSTSATEASKCPFPAMIRLARRSSWTKAGRRKVPDLARPASRFPSGGLPPRKPGSRTFRSLLPPHGADRHREIRPRERGPGSRREDPRRGPRLLRHVDHRDEHR